MKQQLKKWMPPIIVQNIGLFRAYIKYMKYKDLICKNKRFEGVGAGKKLLIIGNGPSLNGVDFDHFKSFDMFACNDFYVHPKFDQLNVKYYFNLDPREIWFNNIVDSLSQEKINSLEFFLPISHLQQIRQFGNGIPNKNYLIGGGERYDKYSRYMALDKPTLGVMNILQILIVGAYYMGYRDIYLAGFDYSFLAFRNKSMIPHFHKGDYRAFKAPAKNNYTSNVCNACKSLTALSILSEILLEQQINIINVSHEDSFLDMFTPIKTGNTDGRYFNEKI
jgi:hypothetical protein